MRIVSDQANFRGSVVNLNKVRLQFGRNSTIGVAPEDNPTASLIRFDVRPSRF